VARFGPAEALERLREGIRGFNERTGGVNSDTAGYHETITALYVRVIARFLNEADPRRSLDDLADALIARFGARDLPARHWSRERLFSSEARREWVEPDLAPLAEGDTPMPF
jgi:hypothetical protein